MQTISGIKHYCVKSWQSQIHKHIRNTTVFIKIKKEFDTFNITRFESVIHHFAKIIPETNVIKANTE